MSRCHNVRKPRSKCEMETRLLEAEEKNQQFSEQTNDALTVSMNRCMRGFVLWQVKTHE